MNNKVKRMCVIAMMGCLAFLLMFLKVSIPFISPFADFDLSAVPELIGGFILGPIGAILIIMVKIALKIAFMGTSSMFTGEIQNVILSSAYVLPAVLIYYHNKTKKEALIGMCAGTVICAIVSIFTNIFIIFPFYINLYGMSWEMIIDMFHTANPLIDSIPMMIIFSVIPCNLLYKGISSAVTYFTYKKISKPLKGWLE